MKKCFTCVSGSMEQEGRQVDWEKQSQDLALNEIANVF